MIQVAIAEDEYYVRQGLQARIRALGSDFELVGMAADGDEAIQIHRQKKPDLFLVDLNMPNRDGFELIEMILNENKPHPIFIIISGYSDFEFMQKAIRYSVFDYLRKPIVRTEFETVLRKAAEEVMNRKQDISFELKPIHHDEYLSARAKSLFRGTLLFLWPAASLPFLQNPIIGKLSQPLRQQGLSRLVLFRQARGLALAEFEGKRLSHESIENLLGIADPKKEGLHVYCHVQEQALEDAMSRVQHAFNERFFRKSFCLDATPLLQKDPGDVDLGPLAVVTEQKDSAAFEREIEARLSHLKQARDAKALGDFYRSVILLLIRLYAQENLIVPESLRQSSLDFSLLACGQWSDVRRVLLDSGHSLIDALARRDQHRELSAKVCDYLQKHFDERINLESLAQNFYVSPSYLSHTFKEETGQSTMAYLENIRLEQAKKLLSGTGISIADVAERVGYKDGNYFTKVFRKAFGLAPSEYRQKTSKPKAGS